VTEGNAPRGMAARLDNHGGQRLHVKDGGLRSGSIFVAAAKRISSILDNIEISN
jgi:hypothetical protein